jgi:hypothetical protein
VDEKTYLIQILLEARERVSQVAQKVAQQLDKVTKAQDNVSDSAKRASAAAEQQRGALEELHAARIREKKGLDDSAAALRSQSAAARQNRDALRNQAAQVRASADALRAQRDATVKAQQASLAEASSLRDLARARAEQVGAIDKTAQQLTRQANAARKEAEQNRLLASSYDKSINAIDNRARALERDANASESAARSADRVASTHERSAGRVSRSIATVVRDLNNLEGRTRTTEAATTRFGRVLQRLGIQSDGTKSSLRGLNAEFQGFQLAIVIKYAQSLLSTLIALGAQLVAVAAAAGQAAAGLGAAFGAAAAQAVPVVGVLAAAFGRLTAVLKAVKLQNQQQLTDTHNTEAAARRQTSAADQIRNAQQQVADAHRNVARAVQDLARTQADASRQEVQAQQAVTQARKDAIRTVQDLIAAERDAQVQLLQAQAQLRGSVQSGDVLGTLAAFDARAAARRGVTRARQDAAPVRARGVEGVDAVQQAEQRVADVRRTSAQQIASAEQQVSDAQRQSRRAEQDLARTRVEAAQNINQETAAADKLTNSIKLLSPAEQQLYRRILALQETYKRAVRPITDIITNAFTGVVDRVNQLLRNPQIMRGFRNIAVEIAGSIRQATSEAGGPRSVGVFELLQREATRNIPIVTRIAVNLFRTLRSLVVDALPAFRVLLGYIEGYARGLRRAVETRPGQLRDFFVQGVRYANQFFKLGLAIVRLLLAIGGRGGAASEGSRTIRELTDYVDHLTDRVNHNAGSIRRFFHSTHDSVKEVLGVLGALATTLIQAFNPGSIKTLADFLKEVIIPAIGTTIQIMGALVNTFHQFLSLPGVAQVAQLAATFLLLARGLDIIHHAVSSILQILPNFLRGFGLMAAEGEAAEGTFLGLGIAMGGWVLIIVGAVIGAIILLNKHFHFLGPTFKWLKGVAGDFFDWIKGAARSVVSWFSDVWNHGLLMWIRAPFIALARIIGRSTLFKAILDDARAVISFFSDVATGGGGWASLRKLLLAPFNYLKNSLKLVFQLIGGIVKVFLDVLAGRFGDAGDEIKGMFNDVISALAGAATSFLGIFSTVLSAMGKIPGIGGPFKDAARAIDNARDSIDKWRDSLGKSNDAHDKSNDTVKKALPNLAKLHDRYQDAEDKLDKLTPDTRAYRTAVKNAADASLDYNTALHDTGRKADGARPSVKTLKDNINQLGGVSADTAQAVAQNLNDVLRQMGAKTIKLNTRAYRHSGIDEMTNVTGHGATGGVLSRALGLRRQLFGGGIANPYGGAADDHILYSPMGAPVAALSGTEGIVNRPQMGVIDQALGFANAMGAVPWGSLNDLWGSGMRHFQTGGGLQPAVRNLSSRLDRMFGLQTVSGYRSNMPLGHPDYHNVGLAADVSGTPDAMARATRYIMSSGIWRSLLEGIHNPGLSVKNGQRVAAGFWGDQWAKHIDHIHIALRRLIGGLPGGGGDVRTPRITGPAGPLLDIARGGARRTAGAANRYLERVLARMGGPDAHAQGADANVIVAFRRAIRTMQANRTERLALWEAGIVESNLRNLTYGDRDSLGALQERTSIYGRAHALDPYASAVRFLTQAKARRPWRGSAGALAQAVQVSAFPGRYDAQRGRALAYLQTGGPIKGVARPGRITTGATTPLVATLSRALGPINTLMDGVSSALESVARGPLQRSKRLATRIARAFDNLTDDGGVLDQMSTAIEAIATRATAALQRRQFRVGRGGARRVYESPAGLAQAQLQTLQSTRAGLVEEQTAIQTGLTDAQRALTIAQRRDNKRAEAVARAAINRLKERQTKVAQDLAQNAQDQVEAQEAFQQALLDSVNAAADQQNTAIDRWSRVTTALGHAIDPNVVLGAQIANMQRQIGGLQGVLRRAMRTGNLDLATTVRTQIDDLNTQIAEAVAQQFQNSIDAVNNQAQRSLGANDRIARRAQIGGTDFGALGASLQQRGGVLDTQRAGLLGLLAQAQASGNIDQIISLADQIDELNTQLLENTQAVRDNTDAGFSARTQQINDAFGFTQTVLSGAQSFFQALTEATGIDTSGQQRASLAGVGAGLATQRQGLTGQLGALIGLSPADLASLQNLNPSDFVNYLVSIASGPAFEAIMARLDPTQQSSFRDLITALVGNVTATQQNTTALTQLTGGNGQGFSSSFWTAFRTAIFTGEGQLLPRFAMTIPSAEVGARIVTSGTLMVHAGETVRPAAVGRDWRGGNGDTYNLNVTSPTEVADPVDFNRQLSFLRRTSGR